MITDLAPKEAKKFFKRKNKVTLLIMRMINDLAKNAPHQHLDWIVFFDSYRYTIVVTRTKL